MSAEVPARAGGDRKALLFCQRCEHASPLDGEWIVVTAPDGTVTVTCPSCGHTVDERPSFDDAAVPARGD